MKYQYLAKGLTKAGLESEKCTFRSPASVGLMTAFMVVQAPWNGVLWTPVCQKMF